VIYAIQNDGKLLWYKHNGYTDGSSSWAYNYGKEVGNGWQNFKQVLSGENGVIYGIHTDGKLLWYKHYGYTDGSTSWAYSYGKEVGNGWQNFKDILVSVAKI
jgi:hypothetical protein